MEAKFNGQNLKDIVAQQKKRLNDSIETYNRNIREVGKRAQKDREKYNIPYTEIGMVAGIGETAVSDFLRGKSVPHLLVVSAICAAVGVLKTQYALQAVRDAAAKSAKEKAQKAKEQAKKEKKPVKE